MLKFEVNESQVKRVTGEVGRVAVTGEVGSEGGLDERRLGSDAAVSPRRRGRRRGIGAVVGWAALGLLVGALVGLLEGALVGFFVIRPSNSDVRDAVWTLVPADAAVIETGAGGNDFSPFEVPYTAWADFDLQETDINERVEHVRRRAENHRWQLVSQETDLGRHAVDGLTFSEQARLILPSRRPGPDASARTVTCMSGVTHRTLRVRHPRGLAGVVRA